MMKHGASIFLLMAMPFLGWCQSAESSLNMGLVAWYPLDGDELDGTGLGEEAIIHGGEWVADRFGTENGAIRLDGVDDYVEIPSSGQINFGDSESFTVALWWSPEDEVSHEGFNGIVNKSYPSGSMQTRGWQLGRSDNDQWFNLQVNGGTEDPSAGMSCGFLQPYQGALSPQLMVLEFDRPSLLIRFELDGNLLTEVVCDALTQSFDNDHPLTLGVEREGVFHSSGRYDDLALWNRLLTVEEKQALQTSGPWFSGCTDELACNYNPNALLDNGTCASCETLQTACLEGTVWSAALGGCVVANPSDVDFDGCVGINDFLVHLSNFGSGCGPWSCGDPLEYQGYDYETVQIGEQCWFAENLRAAYFQNGELIPQNLTHDEWTSSAEPACAIYGEQDSPCQEELTNGPYCALPDVSLTDFGRLYRGTAVMDNRGLCPTGWSVPSDSEFLELEMYAGLEEVEAGNTGWRGDGVATVLKSNSGWHEAGNGVNSLSFDSRPAGYRGGSGHRNAGGLSYFWTSSEEDSMLWRRVLSWNEVGVLRDLFGTTDGFSVRCIQDSE